MKGIVFTEFLKMSEEFYGYQLVDSLIEESNLPSKGIYTAVGTYHHSEIVTLLMNLSKKVNVPPNTLLRTFGNYLFLALFKTYPRFFIGSDCAFDLLEKVDSSIHINVKKLYPDAELPHFEIQRVNENTLWMDYYSDRHMGDLAHGLIEQCIAHYGEKAHISQHVIGDKPNAIRFEIVLSHD
jgi:hypothetical protein